MAVYTAVTFSEMEKLIEPYGIGDLVAIKESADGIENSTYFLTTQSEKGSLAEYVLTIGEQISTSDVSFVARLTAELQRHDLPIPAPIKDNYQECILKIKGKPALLIPKIAGVHPLQPTPTQCAAIGKTLAQLHATTLATAWTHTGHRNLAWTMATGKQLIPHLSGDEQNLLRSYLTGLTAFVSINKSLPQAIIHGDLFRDNALFKEDELVALIDFFSAGTGYLLFDLAVLCNDWCIENRIDLNTQLYPTLLLSYDAVRPLTSHEKSCWPEMLQIAAGRFWISRLADRLLPSVSNLQRGTKNPEPYRALLEAHRNHLRYWPG